MIPSLDSAGGTIVSITGTGDAMLSLQWETAIGPDGLAAGVTSNNGLIVGKAGVPALSLPAPTMGNDNHPRWALGYQP
jgi:hypothetical protein